MGKKKNKQQRTFTTQLSLSSISSIDNDAEMMEYSQAVDKTSYTEKEHISARVDSMRLLSDINKEIEIVCVHARCHSVISKLVWEVDFYNIFLPMW